MRLVADFLIVIAIVATLALYEGVVSGQREAVVRAQLYAHVIAECANGRGFNIATTTVRCKAQEMR